jgi:hypothetical protein
MSLLKMEGLSVGKIMGVNTWAAFSGSNEQALEKSAK